MGSGKVVKICRHCQKEFGLDDIVKQHRNISHGTCDVHFIMLLMEAKLTPKELEAKVKYLRTHGEAHAAPFLKSHPELVKKYKAGIFDEPLI